MAARSPALACAEARLDSTVRRTRPHTSISQLVARLTRSWVVVLLPAAAALAEAVPLPPPRSEEHTSELQSPCNLVCRLLLEKKKKKRCTDVHLACCVWTEC